MQRSNDAKKLLGTIINPCELIEYQAGAVVSRTILRKEAGTVTVFAFDKGQGLSEHIAPFDALVYILEGHARIYIKGKAFLVKAGQILIMPANRPHSLKATQRFKMMLVMVKNQ
ncbi:MAG: cupin domain-containing protein [Candidatus Omnitrophota bacterium]|jgi:quercetin dioxygenase-like cupin family protein|nr:MAG: cupin domain-containing protein [Candidatus Omnitrophota bacterium]